MVRVKRLACLVSLLVLAGFAAVPAEAVRICQNVCNCSAACTLTCRDDNFVPTTCGASIYDCIDKCIVITAAPPVATGVDDPFGLTHEAAPAAGADTTVPAEDALRSPAQ